MCDKLTASTPCPNCAAGVKSPPGGSTTCSSTISWLYDCSKLTGSELKACHKCNKQLIWDHLINITTLVIPFGATYGEWLGGVTDPDLNALIKAFTGSIIANIVFSAHQKRSRTLDHAIIWSIGTGGWVLAAQIIQDYVFHGSPNRVIAAAVAGLANYYRTAGTIPVSDKPSSQEVGGVLIFSTLMAGFAGNWSMMGDNLLSRFMSTTFAGFFAFFGAMGQEYQDCLITNRIFPKEAFMAALQLGIGSSLAGIITDSAFGKPVVSGLMAGGVGIKIAKTIFDSTNFKVCGVVK
jgi:hypothetical protein